MPGGRQLQATGAGDDEAFSHGDTTTLSAVTASRVIGGIGRTVVVAGVILLLFVAYQLWGTGLQHSLAQNELEDDFEENLVIVIDDTATAESETETAETESADGRVVVDSLTTPAAAVEGATEVAYDQEVIDLLPLLYPGNGEASARIRIPAIGVDEIVVFGVSVEDLRKGPGLYDFAPLPGQPGNAAIAGHRTTYGAPFHRLDELRPDDEIIVQTLQGTFTYRVFGHGAEEGEQVGYFIVPPTAVEVLNDQGDNRLTLTACHPKFSARERIIVQAGLVGEPTIPLPRPGQVAAAEDVRLASEDVGDVGDEDSAGQESAAEDSAEGLAEGEIASVDVGSSGFGQGLGGDSGAIPAAILWGTAAAAIWAAAWYVGRKWKRWPAYLLATLPFMVVLFMTFAHVDEALPAY
jgi:sortase A